MKLSKLIIITLMAGKVVPDFTSIKPIIFTFNYNFSKPNDLKTNVEGSMLRKILNFLNYGLPKTISSLKLFQEI